MAFYVFAVTDAAPAKTAGRGLSAPVIVRPVAGVFVAVKRRADVPPLELGSLKLHQQTVERLASRVPAILPVRYGTLLTTAEIEDSLEDRREELTEALDLVRDRRQMTWRMPAGHRPRAAVASPQLPQSGADYLRRASRSASPASAHVFRRVRECVGSLAIAERHQKATDTLPESLYHLVDRGSLDDYDQASTLLRATKTFSLSGPWAPYAFVPDLF
jgi:hypothetical protein